MTQAQQPTCECVTTCGDCRKPGDKCGGYKDVAAAPQAVQPVVPYGWKLVPVDPTREMRSAGRVAIHTNRGSSSAGQAICVFDVMLAVAPAHPADGVPAPNENGAFEAWARGQFFVPEKTLPTSQGYNNSSVQDMWETWKARAALAATQPAAHPGHPLREQALAVTSFLDHAGFDTSHLPGGMGAALRRLRDAAIATQPAAQGLDAKDCDMFWVADEPDQNHDTLHDAVVRAYEDGGLQTDSTVEIQCAKCIGNVVARITSTDPLAFELLIDAELTAQADQGTEMKVSVE